MNIIKGELISEKIYLNDKRAKNINFIYHKKNCIKIKDKLKNYYHFCDNIISENIFSENKKKRNPGIDLIRLMASFLIILTHSIFFGNIFGKYPQYTKQILSLHFLTDWHNNSFALISGIIGYKKCRYSNLIYLWLTVHFYSVAIHIYVQKWKKKLNFIGDEISKDCFPIIYQRYWYCTAYFAMYLFLPVINKGISCLTKSELKFVVLSILTIFILWRDFKNSSYDVFNTNSGYSMLWLLILYLTGAYIGKYSPIYDGLKKYIFCMICVFIFSFLSYAFIKVNHKDLQLGKNYFHTELLLFLKNIFNKRFDSLLKTVQAIIVCFFFLQIHYNKYFDKIICFFGPLAFGVYLIHFHPLIVRNIIMHMFDGEKKDRSLNSVINLLLLKAFKIFVFCLIVEYIRNKIFSALNLRKLCILIERKISPRFN